MSGAARITAERQRQIDSEGWTIEHDDDHTAWELTRAAVCYAVAAQPGSPWNDVPYDWPWNDKWWKPTERIDDLVKAGALLAAEIDRLERKAKAQ